MALFLGRAGDLALLPEEARFFIFLGLLDLDLLLERFPAMNDSYLRRRTRTAFRGGIVNGAWPSFKIAANAGKTAPPAGLSVLRAGVRENGFVDRGGQCHVIELKHNRLPHEAMKRGETDRSELLPPFPRRGFGGRLVVLEEEIPFV